MKKLLITLLLALVVCAGAVELYWDTGPQGGYLKESSLAVLFNDCPSEGPGSTGGREGTVYAFLVYYRTPREYPVSLYLYSSKLEDFDYKPDKPLHDGKLEYEESQENGWTVYKLVEPFDVPESFFAVLSGSPAPEVYNTNKDRDYRHSCFYKNGVWHSINDDIRIRVEWEPEDTAVKETSWGWIKAGI